MRNRKRAILMETIPGNSKARRHRNKMVRPVRKARQGIPEDSRRAGTMPGKMASVRPPAWRRVLRTTVLAKTADPADPAEMFVGIFLMAAPEQAASKEAACTGR